MSRVGLARTRPDYTGEHPPWGPGKLWPELEGLLGEASGESSPSPVYAAVRAALYGAGLDLEHFGSADWNPLGALVRRGGKVVLKPNFIRHWNPCEEGTPQSVVTHGGVVRAVADYAFLAVGPEGSVTVAEAPQHDCDFDRIRELAGLDAMVRFYDEAMGAVLSVIDLRREAVVYRDGVIVERTSLPGDPRGYRAVDLGTRSFFHEAGLDPNRFRGADYAPEPTAEHHRDGRNEYLLAETVLGADLVVNLPKLKTHKKTGVTLALKNLVGINGDKNWLPHHTMGSEAEGGDEYPGGSHVDALRSRAVDVARRLLARERLTRVFRLGRRVESRIRGDDFIRSGNWHGNRTTWRMCLDLNRAFYYSDAEGLHLDAEAPVRTVLTVLDGIVAGEGDGPLAPRDRPLGVVLASVDPVALDLAAVRLMGYDERRLPKVWEAMRARDLPFSSVSEPGDVEIVEVHPEQLDCTTRDLDAITAEESFTPHPGWRGHVERRGAAS